MKKPSYIDYINDFWRFYDECNGKLNVSDIVLYKVLLRYCNKIGWANPFFIDPFLMSQVNPLSKNTYYKSLEKLKYLNLIDYEKGKYNVSKANITILKIKNSTNTSTNTSIDNSIKFSIEPSIEPSIGNNNKTIIQKDNETIRLLNIEVSKKDEKIKEQESLIEEQALLILELKKKLENPKRKSKSEPLHAECKNYFINYYSEQKKSEYYWEGKDAKALNSVIKKIRVMPTANSEESVVLGFEKLISSIKDFDNFIFENLEMTMINSKFNSLIEKIKANKKPKTNGSEPQNYDWYKQKLMNLEEN